MLRLVTLTMIAFLFGSCGDKQARPEVIDKLRVVGVGATPSVVVPSTTANPQVVNLTLHGLLPAGQQVDAVTPYIDEEAKFVRVVSDLAITANSQTYEDVGGLRYFKVQASFVAPDESVLKLAGGQLLRLRYGIDLVAGGETERVVGDVLLVPSDSPALKWQPVTVNMTSPATAGEVVADGAALTMDATSSDGDPIRYSWYVNSGEIPNRRSRIAEWKKPSSGEGVVIATARGSMSRSFAIQVRAVKIE